mgnify:CR=1 FL=1
MSAIINPFELVRVRARASEEYIKQVEQEKEQYSTRRAYYQSHPLEYFRDRLGIKPETIDWMLHEEYKNYRWDGTKNPLKAVLDGLVGWHWVGVESATTVGKTFLGGCIALWFLDNFENSMVVTTAPKEKQLELHIWKEIGKLWDKFNKGVKTKLMIRMIPGKDEWIAVGFVAGVKANEESSTRAQGFHAEHMLFILEETPGIPKAIITALENTAQAPHNLILAFGNPDNQTDNLHLFCNRSNVVHVRISAHDHPNIVLKNPNYIPGAVSQAGLDRMAARYGSREHYLYLSRARGISPAQSIDSLVRMEWCTAAQVRYEEYCDENGKVMIDKIPGNKALGVDVANSEDGDKAAICGGKGRVCLGVDEFQCPDSNQLGYQVHQIVKDEGITYGFVGVYGVGVGAGTVNTLKSLGVPIDILNIQSGSKPIEIPGDEETFNNLRSQMWWQVRKDLQEGLVDIPIGEYGEDLITELLIPKWSTDGQGRIVVEPKKKIKERLGKSPNKADAFVYWNWIRTGRYAQAAGGYDEPIEEDPREQTLTAQMGIR